MKYLALLTFSGLFGWLGTELAEAGFISVSVFLTGVLFCLLGMYIGSSDPKDW